MSSARLKPLLRWTVGSVNRQGLAVLKESITRTTKALGLDRFDWMVCYNNLDEADLSFVKLVCPPVELRRQSWEDCAIPAAMSRPPVDDEGRFKYDLTFYNGSLWKLAPARVRPDAHEIVMDNDVVLVKPTRMIEDFLSQTERPFVCRDQNRYFGRLAYLFPNDERFNSGYYGLPPGYDFAADVRATWEAEGALEGLNYAEEQALICHTLRKRNPYFVDATQVVPIAYLGKFHFFGRAGCYEKYAWTGMESGFHFIQANRHEPHHPWCEYKNRLVKFV
jgi:hypothetical protein